MALPAEPEITYRCDACSEVIDDDDRDAYLVPRATPDAWERAARMGGPDPDELAAELPRWIVVHASCDDYSSADDVARIPIHAVRTLEGVLRCTARLIDLGDGWARRSGWPAFLDAIVSEDVR